MPEACLSSFKKKKTAWQQSLTFDVKGFSAAKWDRRSLLFGKFFVRPTVELSKTLSDTDLMQHLTFIYIQVFFHEMLRWQWNWQVKYIPTLCDLNTHLT